MNASIVDLRYKTSAILEALERREEVKVLYHGKVKGILVSVHKPSIKSSDHPFFGSARSDKKPVKKIMDELKFILMREVNLLKIQKG